MWAAAAAASKHASAASLSLAQVLKRASTDVQQMDVIGWDSGSGDVLLVDFHSMVVVSAASR